MHSVPPVQWDDDAFRGANKWALYTGSSPEKSKMGSKFRAQNASEAIFKTQLSSSRPGIDALHGWYSQIVDRCQGEPSCFQSDQASDFASVVWADLRFVAFADPTGQLAVGRFLSRQGGVAPGSDKFYRMMVPPPMRSYKQCSDQVTSCDTFKGVETLDGCGAKFAVDGVDSEGEWVWSTAYDEDCLKKYESLAFQVGQWRFSDTVGGISWMAVSSFALLTVLGGVLLYRRSRTDHQGFQELLQDDYD